MNLREDELKKKRGRVKSNESYYMKSVFFWREEKVKIHVVSGRAHY